MFFKLNKSNLFRNRHLILSQASIQSHFISMPLRTGVHRYYNKALPEIEVEAETTSKQPLPTKREINLNVRYYRVKKKSSSKKKPYLLEQYYRKVQKDHSLLFFILKGVIIAGLAYYVDFLLKSRAETSSLLQRIEEKIDTQWAVNHNLLCEVQGLESEQWLYLYSTGSEAQLAQHSKNNRELKVLLEANNRLQTQLAEVSFDWIGCISGSLRVKQQQLKRDLKKQHVELKIVFQINKALWLQKQKRYARGFKCIVKAIDLIKENFESEIKLRLSEEKLFGEISIDRLSEAKATQALGSKQLFDAEQVLASAYNSKAKLARCLAEFASTEVIDENDKTGRLYWLKVSQGSYFDALTYDLKSPVLNCSLGFLYNDMAAVGVEQTISVERAYTVLARAVSLQKDNPTILKSLGRNYFLQGQQEMDSKKKEVLYKQSLAYYNKAIELGSRSGLTYTYRGELLIEMDKPKQAEADFTSALKENKAYSHALLERGLLYKIQKKYSEALEDFERAKIGYQGVASKTQLIERHIEEIEKQLEETGAAAPTFIMS